jgi:hypothetical protein
VVDELGRLAAAGLSMVSLWMAVAPRATLDAFGWAAEHLMSTVASMAPNRTSVCEQTGTHRPEDI